MGKAKYCRGPYRFDFTVVHATEFTTNASEFRVLAGARVLLLIKVSVKTYRSRCNTQSSCSERVAYKAGSWNQWALIKSASWRRVGHAPLRIIPFCPHREENPSGLGRIAIIVCTGRQTPERNQLSGLRLLVDSYQFTVCLCIPTVAAIQEAETVCQWQDCMYVHTRWGSGRQGDSIMHCVVSSYDGCVLDAGRCRVGFRL
jgi:hypothetical protein